MGALLELLPVGRPAVTLGEPGKRTTFHVSLHESVGGGLKIEGLGQSVPPNATLLSFDNDAQNPDGELVLLEFYPWTP